VILLLTSETGCHLGGPQSQAMTPERLQRL
jgi:hypothetical protein